VSSFFGLFTRGLIGQTVIPSAGNGTRVSFPASPDKFGIRPHRSASIVRSLVSGLRRIAKTFWVGAML
jgi:hypothetical protein